MKSQMQARFDAIMICKKPQDNIQWVWVGPQDLDPSPQHTAFQ